MQDIHKIYEEAGRLHGHYCPGLAIGVRAAVEAERYLEVNCRENKDLFCIYENSACYLDGIQWVFNTTLGKGNIICHPSGKTVFSFYDGQSGKSVRMRYLAPRLDLGRPEMSEYILTGPLEELFELGETQLPCPQRGHGSAQEICPVCGESAAADKMVMKGGRKLCIDCAAKI